MPTPSHYQVWSCALMGAACVLCIGCAISCSREPTSPNVAPQSGVTPKKNADAPAQPTTSGFPPPDGAVVICRDLSGYYRDCGCSGGTGGVARFQGVTANAEQTHVLFVGRSITPNFTNNKEDAQQLLKLRGAEMLGATNMVWSALGSTFWIAQDDELAALKDANVEVAALRAFLQKSPAKVGIFEIAAKTDCVIVNGTNLELPRADSRGREVLVLAWWGDSPGGFDEWKLDRTLGALVSLTRHGEAVTKEINRIIAGCSRVWTYWKTPVAPTIADDAVVSRAVDRADVLLSHAPDGLAPVSMPYSWDGLDREWGRCASCHEQAYNSWHASKHREAYKTLTDRRRQSDLRCITCHVQQFTVAATSLEVAEVHGAVTCGSCHAGKEPKLACVRCHTDVTDPKKKYEAALRTICPGGTTNSAAKCERR